MCPSSQMHFRHVGPLGYLAAAACLLAVPDRAHASSLHGDALDGVADKLSWVVLIVVPVIAIAVFWLVHILPEKIAEKKKHPQTGAIQCLCLLSLVFGGLLWPIAWLWAYSKPVLYKLAYGTDVDESMGHRGDKTEVADLSHKRGAGEAADHSQTGEPGRLRARMGELEKHLKTEGGPP